MTGVFHFGGFPGGIWAAGFLAMLAAGALAASAPVFESRGRLLRAIGAAWPRSGRTLSFDLMGYLGSPSWWPKAERAAKAFNATTRGAKGAHHSVYVILLHDPRRADPWGLYVGQTSRDPDLRFVQHKKGYKASSAARRFGVRLIPALTEHLNPMRQWESLDLEAALAEAFDRAGVAWVEGGH